MDTVDRIAKLEKVISMFDRGKDNYDDGTYVSSSYTKELINDMLGLIIQVVDDLQNDAIHEALRKDPTRLVNLRNDGNSWVDIAKELNIPLETLIEFLDKNGYIQDGLSIRQKYRV